MGAAGIIQRHERLLHGNGHIHHFPYFLCVHFTKTAAGTGEILCCRENNVSVYFAKACNNAVRRDFFFI